MTCLKRSFIAGFNRNDMFVEELNAFFSIRRGEMEPILDLEEGMLSLEVAMAVKKSLATQNVVFLG